MQMEGRRRQTRVVAARGFTLQECEANRLDAPEFKCEIYRAARESPMPSKPEFAARGALPFVHFRYPTR